MGVLYQILLGGLLAWCAVVKEAEDSYLESVWVHEQDMEMLRHQELYRTVVAQQTT